MKLKNVFNGILAHHLWRHRQHRRFMHNLGAPLLMLGRTKGMLMLGAVALGAEYFRRRKARQNQVPEFVS